VDVTAEPATHGSGSDYCGKITIDNLHLPYMEADLDAFVKKAIPKIKRVLWEQINQKRSPGPKVTVEMNNEGVPPELKGLV
jgi:hypothetical protein